MNLLLSEYEENRTADKKRIKLCNYPLLEETFSKWFKQASSHKIFLINGSLIQAHKYGAFLHYEQYKAIYGLLDGFKKRNNIAFKTVLGEAGR